MFGLRIVLVLAVIASTQGLLFVQGAFILRQDYVASVLCVNRFNPESDCNGTCYLRKQVEQQHGAEHGHDDHGNAPAMLQLALSIHAIQSFGTMIEEEDEPDMRSFDLMDERIAEKFEVTGVFHPPRIG